MSPERKGGGLAGWATRPLRRGLQVARVFWRHGFGPTLRTIGLARFLPSGPDRELDPTSAGLALPVRLRRACEEIGPVTIKIGQALATRPDLIPLEYAQELRHLQDNVPPFPFEQVRQIVEEELGRPLEALFSSFEEEPAASASIGQVHFARLLDGHQVAVKVQRPGLDEIVDVDLQILSFAAREAERHIRSLRAYHVSEWTDEFAHRLRAELDFTLEAHNTERLRDSLASDPTVAVPRVFWNLTTRRVLVLERMEGVRLDDFEGLAALGVSRSLVAANLAQSVIRQIFVNGLFHADPHTGNLLVQAGGRIVFLDCGNTAAIARGMRESMMRLLMGALEEDAGEICDQILDMGIASEDTDLQALRADIQRMLGRYAGLSTSEIRLGEVLEQMMAVIFRHRIRMPTVFASVLRALILAEGNCRLLVPRFDFRKPAEQIAEETLRQAVRPSNVLREAWRAARDLSRYAVLIPRQLSEVLGRMQAGALKVRFEAEHLEEPLRRLDVMFNRLAFALVVAAIIVGSAVMIASERAVSLLSTPGAVAYVVVGALMGLYLLYSILTSGRL